MSFDDLLSRAAELRRAGVRGRYAPSPTGPLHPGNLRTALVAWLQARLEGGAFVLRMEDLDRPRVVEGSADQILDDLRWLGLDWDEGPDVGGPLGPYEQSARDELYAEALDRLDRAGLVFPCYCSRKDIAEAASAPHGRSPVYPGTCRELTPAERERVRAEKNGKTPSWRFRVHPGLVTVDDRVAGPFRQDLDEDVGDFVVRRADELFAYQLAVVVDDLLMGITDVVRGADLLESTPRQVALFEALGAQPPRYWHVPMMRDASGEHMSKRDGSQGLAELRAEGLDAPTVVGRLAASIGLVDAADPVTPARLLQALDTTAFLDRLRRENGRSTASSMRE